MVASFVLALLATFLNINVINYAVHVTIPSPGAIVGSPAQVTLSVVPWAVFTLMIVLSTISVLYYCVEAVRAQHMGLVRNIKQIVLLVIIGYGISMSNSVSALSGLLSPQTGTFLRTPKYNITGKSGTWKEKKYQLSLNRETAFEMVATAVGVIALVYALALGNIGIVPILAVYVTGYVLVLYLTLSQSVSKQFSG